MSKSSQGNKNLYYLNIQLYSSQLQRVKPGLTALITWSKPRVGLDFDTSNQSVKVSKLSVAYRNKIV